MATDGVKIIDGDTAHDTYWGIMDLYDSGADSQTIEREFPLIQPDFVDEFDNEIYVTSCGLALWEIGLMTPEKLAYIQSIIDKGVTVAEWSKENAKEGQARERELKKYLKKITQVNSKVRARKKYRKITNLYFSENDILTFKVNEKYKAVICVAIDQYRGNCNYKLVLTTYSSPVKPTAEELLKAEILGVHIGSGYTQAETRSQQPGIEKLWAFAGGTNNHFFGLAAISVAHKDFINLKHVFEVTGTIKIKEALKEIGAYECTSKFARFEVVFGNLESHIKTFRLRGYPIQLVCEEGA